MDHIPRPANPAWEPSAGRLYTSLDFEYSYKGRQDCIAGYIKRIGLSFAAVTQVHRTTRTRDETHRILQEWLYFGLLAEVTRSTVRSVDFLAGSKSPSGELLLCSKPLTSLLETGVIRYAQTQQTIANGEMDVRPNSRLQQHHHNLIALTYAALDEISSVDPAYLDETFLLSMSTLLDVVKFLTANLALISEPSPSKLPMRSIRKEQTALIGQMELLGWCRSTRHMLQQLLSSSELVFTSMLEVPGGDKNHSNCTEHACYAY